MKHLYRLIAVAVLLALLGAFISTLHTYIDGERWAWYDAGFKAATEIYSR